MIELKYDGLVDLATGRNRKETIWKNKPWLWSDLVKKLSTTHRTAESYAEYLSSKKSRQDEIKDIGGFVGGLLTAGRRKAGSVVHRQLLTLDIDFGHASLWEDVTLLYGYAMALYSTHKHAPDHPRYRLIMPLSREVGPDEYQAIARRVAEQIGIECFDHTTYEANRLMYWPSTARDGVYVFEYQDGAWLDADAMLATYTDWRDTSEWPQSDRENNVVKRGMAKQGDPLEKPGIIGAFCRTYGIAEAVETFLADVYEACAVEDRYTYKEGSTAAGLVVYEDKFAYSHHGTDPASGKLCNAFDLVRLHKFGLKDEDAKEGTPTNKMPSYKAMMDWAVTIGEVKKTAIAERMHEARGDFDQVDIEDDDPEADVVDDDPDDSWIAQLKLGQDKKVCSTIDNVRLVLCNDPMLKGRLAMDLFERREVALRNLPWRKVTHATRYLTDMDDAGLRHYLEATYDITGVQKIKDALDMVVAANAFHPVRDYLDSLTWDGVKRLDRVLIDYLGAEDTPYTRAVTRKALCAAVTRIYHPGAKYDYVLTLVGKQGQKKSMLIDKLGRQWFSDSVGTVQGKEAFEALQGVWLIELAELAQLKKAEVEQIKHFISKREDRYRVAYGRRTENFPRQCVFFGTSNNKDFLRDATGNRRFWPVATYVQEPYKDIADGLTEHEVNQIWAEAIDLYRKGERLYLTPELEALALEAQREHSEVDERAGLIQAYLEKPLPENWHEMDLGQRRAYLAGGEDVALMPAGIAPRKRVCVAEIWEECLGGLKKEMTTHNTKFIHDIMKQMDGWELGKGKAKFTHYGVQICYIKSLNTRR